MKLFILDIDNTVTDGPSIWELIHQQIGTWARGEKYLQQFNNKEINFKQFAAADVRCWQGQKLSTIEGIFSQVIVRKGFPEFLDYLKSKKIKIAVISSSIKQFVNFLDKKNNFDYVIANPLIIKAGVLTGEITIDICCFDKGRFFEEILTELQLSPCDCGGVGDSIYDLAYLETIQYPFIMGDKLPNEKIKRVNDFVELKSCLKNILEN